MARRIIIAGGVVALLVAAAIGYFVFRPPEEPSAPIAAIPIDSMPTSQAEPTAAPAAPAQAEPTAAPAAPAQTGAGEAVVFEIVPDESQVRFVINEVLRGAPTEVVGVTGQVAGQIAIDPTSLANAKVGIIQVNARTLATDNSLRNRAIRNFILRTNEHEFVTFTPTAISGLPEQGSIGTPYTFQISGDLTIAGVTKPVTFEATVTAPSEERLEGSAATTVLYRDFNLSIPDSPQVDTVDDEVRLEIDFVAVPTS